MGESFLQRVDKEILVMSGAMGTMLHQVGAGLGGCIGQWIVEHPEVYHELVQEYFAVGCGSSPLHLKAIVKKVREFGQKE